MQIISSLLHRLRSEISELYGDKTSPDLLEKIVLEQPKNPSHGCLSSNASMVLAKPLRQSPRDIASKIVPILTAWDEVSSAEIAGAGFINLVMKNDFWQQFVNLILKEKENYGRVTAHDQKINVEYVSANPTGPLHVANARGAVIGDVIANIFEWNGYQVTREYYVNDAGEQIKILAQSTFARYKEALGKNISFGEELYPGEYLIPIAKKLKEKYGSSLLEIDEQEALNIVSKHALEDILKIIKNDLAQLGVKQNYISESKIMNKNKEQYLEELKKRKLVYEGTLPPPKSVDSSEWKQELLLLFASSKFGDDVDRALTKSDGSPTYFGNDLLYHAYKIKRGYSRLINVLGADHGGYVSRLKAIVSALSDNSVRLDVPLCQLVKLTRSGKPYVMSKRSGNFVRLSELVELCGAGAVRFFMLMRKQDAPLDFDIDIVAKQTHDNPVFYVQYAHARACSVLRHAEEIFGKDLEQKLLLCDKDLLNHEQEKEILRKIAFFPLLINSSIETIEPHKIAFYTRDLAASFHSLWNLGSSDNSLKFINQKKINETMARVSLVLAFKHIIANSLNVLGIKPLKNL